jgi:hypothetical protein
MNITLRMTSWNRSKETADIPFEEIKQSWRDLVGKFTIDGDYVESIHDVYETEFMVNIIARNPETIKRFSGDKRLTMEPAIESELQFKI